jgi:membrane protein DedA with SNARE-associated domain
MFEIVQAYIAEFTYAGIFLILLLCGFGLPLPEDIPILISGYLAYKGTIEIWPALAVTAAGVLIGDIVIYSLGRWWGPRSSQHRLARAMMTPGRMAKVEKFFSRHGKKAIFFGRFVAGLRAPLFLAAGVMRMPLRVFLGMDMLAAALSVPSFFFLAFYFGDELDTLRRMLGTTKDVLFLLLGAAGAAYALRFFILRRRNGALSAAGKENGVLSAASKENGSPASS